MFRVVSIIKEPHIGVSFIDKDGHEISDDYSGERYASIYECDYKIFVQDDEGYIGVYSEQYEELFGEKTADEFSLRPYYGSIGIREFEEFVKAYALEAHSNDPEVLEEGRKRTIDLLRRLPESRIKDEVRELYNIQKPTKC